MGEAMLVRRGSQKQEPEVTATNASVSMRSGYGQYSTGVSVSDMENPEIGKNVFVQVKSADVSGSGSYGSVTLDFSPYISGTTVYVRGDEDSSAYSLSSITVTVYKVYT